MADNQNINEEEFPKKVCTRQRPDYDGRSRWCDLCIGFTGWQRPQCPELLGQPASEAAEIIRKTGA